MNNKLNNQLDINFSKFEIEYFVLQFGHVKAPLRTVFSWSLTSNSLKQLLQAKLMSSLSSYMDL